MSYRGLTAGNPRIQTRVSTNSLIQSVLLSVPFRDVVHPQLMASLQFHFHIAASNGCRGFTWFESRNMRGRKCWPVGFLICSLLCCLCVGELTRFVCVWQWSLGEAEWQTVSSIAFQLTD